MANYSSFGSMSSMMGKLRGLIYNDPGVRSTSVDKAIDNIAGSLQNKDSMNYAELISRTIGNSVNQKQFDQKIGNSNIIFDNIETVDRIGRYSNAQEIADSIPYCARALNVLTDNITSPDGVTKESIQFFSETSTEEFEKVQNNARTLKENTHIESMIDDIVYDTLQYGDQFIEIANIESKEIPITDTMLTEDVEYYNPEFRTHSIPMIKEDGKEFEKQFNVEVVIDDIEESNLEDFEDKFNKVTGDYNILSEDKKNNKKSNKDSSKLDIKHITLINHDVTNVIKLQSKKYRLCLGYLVLPYTDTRSKYSGSAGRSTNPTMPNPTNRVHSLSHMNPNAEDGLDKVYKQILDMVKSHLGKSKELSAEEEEVKILLSKAIRNLTTGENLKIRYIPPNRMQHFTIRPRRFFPYGESLFYKSTFPAKLLIALETAVTVRRISDSSEKRLIYYETGLPRQGRDIIETIRETLTKRKVSVDTMGSVGTIPSMLTSFEEIYLPQKDGKRHVEFDKLEPQTNIRDATDELKYFRDKIIASLNVPPPFLSLEENISNKNALTHESDLFARSIISYQQTFSTHLKSLFSKMYQLTFKERMVGVNVSLPVPKLLQIEREADHYENVNRIAEVLKGFEVPFNYVREKYLSFDWEEIEKYKRRDQLEKHRSLDKGQDDGSGDETGGFGQGM